MSDSEFVGRLCNRLVIHTVNGDNLIKFDILPGDEFHLLFNETGSCIESKIISKDRGIAKIDSFTVNQFYNKRNRVLYTVLNDNSTGRLLTVLHHEF
jgi:hypothetical protein